MFKLHYVTFITNGAGISDIRTWINLAESAVATHEREGLQGRSLIADALQLRGEAVWSC